MRSLGAALVALVCVLGSGEVGATGAPNWPGVDLKGLNAEALSALSDLMKEGPCPCDPKQSLFACIEAKSCEKATELADFGARKFREGLGVDQVREAVVQKFLDDNVNFDFDLKGSPRKGAAAGRIVIVEFADFECPHCALVSKMWTEILKAYPNDVTLYFKHFPLPSHTEAEPAARASYAADLQGKFWPMHDLIFENQMELSAEKLIGFAEELGLNVAKFKVDMASPAAAALVGRDKEEGVRSNLTGTPTLFVNGKLYHDDKTVEAIKAHLASVLKKLPPPPKK